MLYGATSLLVSDFDNTQAPTSSQLVKPNGDLGYTFLLKEKAESGEVPLVHCSGRTFPDILRDIENTQYGEFPGPHAARAHAILAAVGTEAYEWNPELEEYIPLEGLLDQKAANFFTENTETLMQALEMTEGLKLQDPENQSQFKISAWKDPETTLSHEEVVANLKDSLAALGISEEDIAITVSMQSKLAVDFTPQGATKGNAVRFIADHYGVSLANVYFAGDSSNDADGMAVEGINRILPANAQDILKENVAQIAAAENRPESVFQADGDCAKGVLQGLAHFGVLSEMPALPDDLHYLSDWQPDDDVITHHPRQAEEVSSEAPEAETAASVYAYES